MPIVRDLMTVRPTAIRSTARVRVALATMMELDVRHLPVIDEDQELVGMVSDRDLRGLPYVEPEVEDLMGDRRARLEDPVTSIMSSDVIAVDPEDDLMALIEAMLDHKIGAVPVVSPERRLVGIVSYMDILRRLGRDWSAVATAGEEIFP